MRPPQTPTVTKSLFANYLRLLRVLPQTATDDLRAYPAAARSLRRREDAGRRACQSPARPQSTGRRPASHMRSARYRARHRVRPQDPAMREARTGLQHSTLDGLGHPPSDLLRQRYLCRTVEIQVQRLVHVAVVHDFFALLVLFSRPVWGIFGLVEGESP